MHRSILRVIMFSLLLAACGGSKPATQASRSTATDDPSCPVSVPGTSVSVDDAATGAALVFVTTGDVAELRRRAAAMAKMHNDHHAAMGPLPEGNEAGGHDHSAHAGHDMGSAAGGHDMSGHEGHDMSKMGGEHAGHAGGMIGVHSKASASDIDGGAKILFTSGGADVGKLQSELRMHAKHFASGTCAMGNKS